MSGTPSSVSSFSSRHTFSWFLLIGANVLWASSYVAAKLALTETSVTLMLALRMSIAGLVLIPLLIVKRKELHLSWRHLPQLALLCLVGFVLNKLLEFGGLSLTTASDVALLIASESIFTAALSWLLLRERVRWRSLGALALGFVGVYLIINGNLVPTLPAGGGSSRLVGNLLVMLALVLEAFYTVRGKSMLAQHSPLLITSASIVGSMFFWLPVAGGEVIATGWHLPGLVGWGSILWLAIACTALAYLAWFQGLARVDGSAASSTLFLQPLIGPLLGVFVLHEELTLYTILGGIFIIVGVYIISRQE